MYFVYKFKTLEIKLTLIFPDTAYCTESKYNLYFIPIIFKLYSYYTNRLDNVYIKFEYNL